MIFNIIGKNAQATEMLAHSIRDRLINNKCGCTIIREDEAADRKAQIEKLIIGVPFTVPASALPFKVFPTLVTISEEAPVALLEEIESAAPGIIPFLGEVFAVRVTSV